jgi:hypothetical protein
MRRLALLGLTMTVALPLAGCGDTWWNPPLTGGYSPHRPVEESDNIRRVQGMGVATAALQTEPGDVWPGPLPPTPTIGDMQDLNTQGALPPPFEARDPNAPPLPNVPARPRVTPPAAPSAAAAAIVVPNGNGTNTVIHPDGRIETIPAAK